MKKEEQLINIGYRLPYNIQFFADQGADKTEEPTSKKLNDARSEGQAPRSKELITASALAVLFIVLKFFVGFFGDQFINSFKIMYANIETLTNQEFNMFNAQSLLAEALRLILFTCLPVFIFILVVTIVIILFQVKWKVSGKTMKPKFNKINPISGFKRIISKDKIVELVIDIIKIIIISYIAYSTLKSQYKTILILFDMNLENALILLGDVIINLGIKISMIFLVIGFADLIYQKIKFKKDMRMTKQEVKDEYKNSEGDPQIKSKIRAKMREVSTQRMMQSLPKADVVITNPTHFAAAIQYDKNTSAAPVLLAKGADFLAQKIKEAAKENNIEIVENKPLARMLYYNVEIGAEIPPELYQMTAEVLAYVYGLKNKAV